MKAFSRPKCSSVFELVQERFISFRPGAVTLALILLLLLLTGSASFAVPILRATSGEFLINTETFAGQQRPAIVRKPTGEFMVAFEHSPIGKPLDVGARLFRPDGNPVAAQFVVNKIGEGQYDVLPKVGIDGNGNYVVAWQSFGSPPSGLGSLGVFFRRFNAVGVALNDDVNANSAAVIASPEPGCENNPSGCGDTGPALAVHPVNGFVIVWHSYVDAINSWDVFARRFDSQGNALGAEFRVNTFRAGEQRNPDIAINASGEILVAWQSVDQDGSGRGIFGRRFDAANNPLSSEFQVNAHSLGTQELPGIAMNSRGDAVIVWRGAGQGGASGVFARLYSPQGAPRSGDLQVSLNPIESEGTRMDVAMDISGNYVVAWEGVESGALEIKLRGFGPDGVGASSQLQVNTTTESHQAYPVLALDQQGGLVVVWHSYGQDGSEWGVYGRLFLLEPNNPPPVNRSPVFRPSDIPTGLLGYWKLDEASGTRADSSGRGNHLAPNNVGSVLEDYWSSGDRSADFESTSYSHLSISDR